MINPTTQQVFQIADYFHNMANAIGDYIQKNRAILSAEERNNLYNSQIALLQDSGEMNMLGTSMVFEDIEDSLTALAAITDGVHDAVKKALAVQDAINVATNLIQLATAVLSKNPKEIANKSVAAFNAVKSVLNN